MASIAARVAAGPRPFHYPNTFEQEHRYDENENWVPPLKDDFAIKWHHPSAAGLRDYRPLVIGIWMRKGGVAKTNTAYMLAHALAKEGKPTLMVDCDSQQDLTELAFRAEAETNGFDDVEQYLASLLPQNLTATRSNNGMGTTCANLASALRFALEIDKGNIPPQNIPPHATAKHLLFPFPFPVGLNANVKDLYHVAGGLQFETMENKLNEAIESFRTICPNRNGPGALFHAIWNAGYKCNARVIVLDLSPALGTTNQTLLMHCDYYLCPCECTTLCEKNLLSLQKTVPEWYKAFQKDGPNIVPMSGIRDMTRGVTADAGFVEGSDLPLPEVEPKFLGIVLTKYDVQAKSRKRDARGNMVDCPEEFKGLSRARMARRLINAADTVANAFRTPRTGANFAVDEDVFTQPGPGLGEFRHPRGSLYCPQPYLLGRVRKATPLFEAAHSNCSIPISLLELGNLDAVTGFHDATKKEETFEDVAHYRRVFSDMAKFILHLPKPAVYNFVFNPSQRVLMNTIDTYRSAGKWQPPAP